MKEKTVVQCDVHVCVEHVRNRKFLTHKEVYTWLLLLWFGFVL